MRPVVKDKYFSNIRGAYKQPAYKRHVGRVYYFDMTGILNRPYKHAERKRIMIKELDPFNYTCSVSSKRAFIYPEELESFIDEYFSSCMGVAYGKNGLPILDFYTKQPVMIVRTPYTIAGLARHLGISTSTLRGYEKVAKAGLIPPEFAEIVLQARQKVESYAEQRIYDRDGSSGAQFVLQYGFDWQTKGQKSMQSINRQRLLLQKQELELKRQLLDCKEDGDSITINVTRANKQEQEMEEE